MSYKKILPVKSDIVFRLFFADERNKESLISFLKSVLRLPDDDYNKIEVADPHLLPEYTGDKFAVIDIKLHTASRKVIHIEIQLQVTPEMRERIVFYDAKLITEQIGKGENYDVIRKVISIVITDKKLIPVSPRYHHRFTLYDPEAGAEFSDMIEIHTLELAKLPDNTDGTILYDWARFIAAESEEELQMIEDRNPQVHEAAIKLRELSADEQARDMYERREKARRDQASVEKWARIEGRQEGRQEGMLDVAKNMLADGDSVEKIVRCTGLSFEKIEELRHNKQ